MSDPTPISVFSDDWAKACQDLINANAAYRDAAQSWEGAVLLLMSDGPATARERRVYLDLWHGACRGARAAGPADEAEARYILLGTAEVWRQVLTGRVAPLFAVATGKLRLAKGPLLDLLPYAAAAKELIAAACGVPASFPDDW